MHSLSQSGAKLARLLFSCLSLTVLTYCASVAFAAQSAANNTATTRAHSLTNALLVQHQAHQRGRGDPSQVAQDFLTAAAQRQQAFAALITENPGDALRLAIPANLRQRLPAAVRGYVEENVELAGTFETRYVHYERNSRQEHFLNSNGRQYSLHFHGKPPELLTGSRVRVRALRSGTALLLDAGSTGGATALLVEAPALANTFGEQRTLVLLVNFSNNATQPFTTTQTTDIVFGSGASVSNYMREASFQQTWLSGNVFGWYTLPIAATCDGLAISRGAKEAAVNAGVDLAAYSRYVYIFPRNDLCGWSGMGTVGGWPSETLINGKLEARVIGHEIGHNFGLWHSHAHECGVTVEGSACTSLNYGDMLDIMGNTNAAHFNTFQKERLGWLNYNGAPPIVAVENGGTFTLEPYASSGSGPKALKVLKGVDSVTGNKSWYYVEYRQALGFDAFLAGNANVLGGVVVRSGVDGDGDSSHLLDQTPNSSANDWADPALTVGRSFTGTNGAVITTLSAGGAAASVSVTPGTQPCVRSNPAFAMTPSQSASVVPGTAVAYAVTVTNRDTSECGSSQFDLAASVASGWNASYASGVLNLAPGASASTTLTVSSATSATTGFYNVGASTINHAQSSYAASAMVSYVVAESVIPPTNLPPVAVSDSATTTVGTKVTIDVLSNDSDPEGQPLTVASVTQGSSGTVTISGGAVVYTPKAKFKGTDTFLYSVSDGTNSVSATVTVSVQALTTGGRKR